MRVYGSGWRTRGRTCHYIHIGSETGPFCCKIIYTTLILTHTTIQRCLSDGPCRKLGGACHTRSLATTMYTTSIHDTESSRSESIHTPILILILRARRCRTRTHYRNWGSWRIIVMVRSGRTSNNGCTRIKRSERPRSRGQI